VDEQKKTIYLPCELDNDEVVEAAKSMAEQLSKVDQLDDQLASAKKQISSDIDACNAQIAKLRDMVRTGIEYRHVDCTISYDWPRGKKTITREDTGEVEREETISESERQQHMFEEQKAARVQ
jgi:hypothetical protein